MKNRGSEALRVVQQEKPCYRCGNSGHVQEKCRFKDQKCHKCGKQGHIARVCRSYSQKQFPRGKYGRGYHSNRFIEQKELDHQEVGDVDMATERGEAYEMFNVKSTQEVTSVNIVHSKPTPEIKVQLKINGIAFMMEVDTGASVSIISEKTWKQKLPKLKLQESTVLLKAYTGQPIKIAGQAKVDVTYGEQEANMPLIIVEGEGPSLFGRNWMQKIQLDWKNIGKMKIFNVKSLLHEYDELFAEGLGTMKDIEAKLTLKENAVPKFCRARSVPYAIKEAIARDLERMKKLGVIEEVSYSDWATPVVPVPKPDGSVRLCGDFKITVNPALQVDQYPIPKPEDLLATLAGGQKFTKLDLTQAYQQMQLAKEDRKYTTINTHQGLYQYTRLPYGMASAPAVFQQAMDKILHGIPRVICYIDDILITGEDDRAHCVNLEEVLRRLKERGLRLKKNKCQFLQPSVKYLGYEIDAAGLHTAPEKVKAVIEAPQPKNQQQLRAFLGLVNYYGKFLQALSTTSYPLNQLLKKNVKWKWTAECEAAFHSLKEQLSSSAVLAHYDPSLPLKLACDASSYGVGAVISHEFPDGVERPVAYASRTLNRAEKNYPQIEREALAIVFGVKKFHQYVYGRKFILITDHKPLVTILGPRKGLPALAAARLQHWAVTLSAYNYDAQFRPTEQHCNADGLSRLPILGESSLQVENVSAASLFNIKQINSLPLKPEALRNETARDPVLSNVLRYTLQGWPQDMEDMDAKMKPYFLRKEELTISGAD